MTKYMSNIYNGVYSVLLGMVITLRQLFKPSVTHQYPYENDFEINDNIREIPVGFRGQLHNRVEDCIVCKKLKLYSTYNNWSWVRHTCISFLIKKT